MYTKDELGYKKRLKKRSKRPMGLTIVCALVVLFGFIYLIEIYLNVPKMNLGEHPGMKTIYPALNALVIVFSFVSISGVWSMEKWGPITFPFIVLFKILIDLLLLQKFNPWYLLGFVVAVYFFRFYKQMKHSE